MIKIIIFLILLLNFIYCQKIQIKSVEQEFEYLIIQVEELENYRNLTLQYSNTTLEPTVINAKNNTLVFEIKQGISGEFTISQNQSIYSTKTFQTKPIITKISNSLTQGDQIIIVGKYLNNNQKRIQSLNISIGGFDCLNPILDTESSWIKCNLMNGSGKDLIPSIRVNDIELNYYSTQLFSYDPPTIVNCTSVDGFDGGELTITGHNFNDPVQVIVGQDEIECKDPLVSQDFKSIKCTINPTQYTQKTLPLGKQSVKVIVGAGNHAQQDSQRIFSFSYNPYGPSHSKDVKLIPILVIPTFVAFLGIVLLVVVIVKRTSVSGNKTSTVKIDY
ncbi:hypothetical protein CYY_008072 [Polysphondylium violaceum]|uniref:IPT/TIG domain-containing protein n=1 Tax=Polysphondylium violaceum TaxID=133409 RepID=A0A8J4PMB6_9MYCE|nr:hypothetical protein CYY_008072 [Polysphondylium violaceum]